MSKSEQGGFLKQFERATKGATADEVKEVLARLESRLDVVAEITDDPQILARCREIRHQLREAAQKVITNI